MKLVPKKVRQRLGKHLIKNFQISGHDFVLTSALCMQFKVPTQKTSEFINKKLPLLSAYGSLTKKRSLQIPYPKLQK